MIIETEMKEDARDKMRYRLYGLLDLQKETEDLSWADEYNIFIFGSYVTIWYVKGRAILILPSTRKILSFIKKWPCIWSNTMLRREFAVIFSIQILQWNNQFMASLSISKYSLQIISH